MASVPLFLYGTLRVGQRLHHLVQPYVEFLFPAEVEGRLYHHPARRRAQFPVARFNEQGTIIGELAIVRFTPTVRDVIHMELTSGYGATDVTVHVLADDHDDYIEAIGFHYPLTVGTLIPTGDWLDTPEAQAVIANSQQTTEGDNVDDAVS